MPEPSATPANAGPSNGRPGHRFHTVGIGCSAGGLDALNQFFSHTEPGRGDAYVVVQHLAPDHVSALPEILQRVAGMPVVEISDGLVVAPDHVYVIPPNKDLSILHGVLRLFAPVEPRGLRLPIDFFLRSLAQDQREAAIGVILSGMGSDGTLGLRAIKENGGLTLVQSPSSALAASMPQSAIDADLADIVGHPEELATRMAAVLNHPVQTDAARSRSDAVLPIDIDHVIILLREQVGVDFSQYKPNTLVRRITRRIALHQLDGIGSYLAFLRSNPQEGRLLFKELLIGVTQFFRDPVAWECLRTEAIPALLRHGTTRQKLRAWVSACSSGEEAYSLAMVFKEALAEAGSNARSELLIYATDLDQDAIARARAALYPKSITSDINPARLSRFFTEEANGYRIRKEIREMVVFATHNMVSDPPFTRLDILVCRNLLIYFSSELQSRMISLMHYALNRGGLLLLGSAETPGAQQALFSPVNNKARLYQRSEESFAVTSLSYSPLAAKGAPMHPDNPLPPPTDNLGHLTDALVQQEYAPAAVLVNGDGDILYISGRTGAYLEPPAGKVNINIHAMAREGLREALSGLIARALRDAEPIIVSGVRVAGHEGPRVVDLIVRSLQKPAPLRGRVLVVFKDAPVSTAPRRRSKAVASEVDGSMAQELLQTRESLRFLQEEMQRTVEELKSSNEELQSTNEELQSANEELTTSKEEMQSLNEELTTVNAELQAKVENLTWAQNDMTNLLNSTEIVTVFLDAHMKLRRFTSSATKLFKLILGDVGRPLSDVATGLQYGDLQKDALEVLHTLAFQEREVTTIDGRWYRVRIMPYRTQDNVIDGVVITFTDISELKYLQGQVKTPASAGLG
jgi:chemotaxis methyl-accepting protein methylase/PAS domain-containing protein